MSEYIDVYIDTTTKVPEDATEFDYELFERFMSGGPWVAHSKYMELKADNAKLLELVRLMVRRQTPISPCKNIPCGECPVKDECDQEDALMRELGIEVDG